MRLRLQFVKTGLESQRDNALNTLIFCLIHSPLAGPFTWVLVRNELAQRDIEAVVPRLPNFPDREVLYWKAHASAVAKSVEHIPLKQELVLVEHSGAGPLSRPFGR